METAYAICLTRVCGVNSNQDMAVSQVRWTVLRKRRLLMAPPLAIVLLTLLVGCGASTAPTLQFDAAAEPQHSDAIAVTGLVLHDAVSKTEAARDDSASTVLIGAKAAAPVYNSDSGPDDRVDHDRLVRFARTAALSTAGRLGSADMDGRYAPKLARTSTYVEVEEFVEGDADLVTQAEPEVESDSVTESVAIAQPGSGTPDAALQDATFTLVTVDTADGGQRVEFVPSAGYDKVCPHRLRMASEFSDQEVTDF